MQRAPHDPFFEGVAEEDMGQPKNMLGVEPSESDRMDDVDENDVDEFDERQPRSKPKKAVDHQAFYERNERKKL